MRKAIWLLWLTPVLFGQAQPKRALTHKDYDGWRTISSARLSPDGQWLAYAFMPQEGNGELVVKNVATGAEFRHAAGALPPPPVVPAAEVNPEAEPPRLNLTIRFTSDNRFVLANYFPAKGSTGKAGVMIVRLADNLATRVDGVKTFAVPAKGGAWVAMLKEASAVSEAAKPSEADEEADQRRGGRPAAGGAAAVGSDLLLRDLASGSERTLPNVTEYSFARDGKLLAYAVNAKQEDSNGVYAVVPGDAGAPVVIRAEKGRYSKLTWDRAQTQLAFVTKTGGAWIWKRGSGNAAALAVAADKGVVDRGTLAFSRDGQRLFVPTGKATAEATTAADPNKVQMDLWHWRDDLIQPMQRVRANTERARTYRGVYHIAADKFVVLADETLPDVTPSDDGLLAVGSDTKPYRRMVDYDGTYADFYLVNTLTGERRAAVKKLRGSGFGGGAMQWAPDGQHALFFQDGQWSFLQSSDASVRVATKAARVAFADEQDDTPDPANAYGTAGWAKDSRSALVYDRYDVWQIFTDASVAPKRLTNGRAEQTSYRVQRIDAADEEDGERGLDLTQPLVLRAANEETRDTGFFRRAVNGNLEKLLWGARNYLVVARASDAPAMAISASRFDEYPDLHITNTSFAAPRKVTNGGAQLDAFAWGQAETVRFRNTDGVALKGTLFKPANFDAAKKYPMIIYIYERLSQNLHTFVNPSPGTSINIPYYVSNGYLVLTPDIVYTRGYPGQSALKCVLPAIDAVVARGFVDEKAIGIQGHSWGGYQIAYMITQTNRFRAAEAGAPVGNMTSAYSGIRWGTGLPRQFQYEQTQSRIGHTLYQNPQRFLENSPVFYAERIQTPLLMVHNDADDAVPWYQGIELYLAMRRNEKEAYLMNYNGEYHGLRRRHNQKDWTVRMQQFFDHHLKAGPQPDWMERGVPFLERETEKEKFAK